MQSYGQVEQEKRVSGVIDIMIAHVENLKRRFQREHTELEETKSAFLFSTYWDGRVVRRGGYGDVYLEGWCLAQNACSERRMACFCAVAASF